MKAVIYARISTDAPGARTIDDQIASCRERCEREGWVVVDVFADKSSGSGALDFNTRPGVRAMLGRVAVGGIDRVVTETSDRIARKHAEASAVLKFVKRTGARLVTVSNTDADIAVTISALLEAAVRYDRMTKITLGKRARSASDPGKPSV